MKKRMYLLCGIFAVVIIIASVFIACSHPTDNSFDYYPSGPVHSHQWDEGEIITPATCTTTGTRIRTCILDGTTMQEVIPIDPNAHDWQQLSGTAPTCTTAGNGTRKCNLCKKEENGVLPVNALGHQWANNWTITTPPTVVQEGTETDTCIHNTSHTRTRSITAATFTDIADLETYLSGLSDNTAAAAYTVKLNVNDIGGDVRTAGSVGYILSSYNTPLPPPPTLPARTSTKYVNLDLSGSTLTYIEVQAFQSCYGLAGVIIPNSVTEIRGSAFNRCTGLTSVTIPSSVTILADWAFGTNENLTSVTFQGTIPAADFGTMGVFFGDLRDKFYATNATNGTAGTYTTTAPVSATSVWTKD